MPKAGFGNYPHLFFDLLLHHNVKLSVSNDSSSLPPATKSMMIRVSLYLDPQIRDWVLFPITLVMVCPLLCLRIQLGLKEICHRSWSEY